MLTSLVKNSSANESKYMVPVLRSTFQIMEELSQTGALKLNQITLRTGLPKSTVFRILRSLDQLGYILYDEEGKEYSLSPNLAELGRSVAWSEPLRKIALPQMLDLRRRFGETVNLGEVHLDRAVYLEVIPSEHPLDFDERRGSWVYVHASSLGKAILAFSHPEFVETVVSDRTLPALTPNTIVNPRDFLKELEQVRKQGYAFDLQEVNMLGNCVAAPIRDRHGTAVAAISISGPAARFKPKSPKVVEAVQRAAKKISKHFGWGRTAHVAQLSRQSRTQVK